MWSWEHIKKHRRMCKEYTAAYLKKLDTSKPGKDMIENLEVGKNWAILIEICTPHIIQV